MSDKKKYLLNGFPVSATELIDTARAADEHFGRDGIFTTSEAAAILREHGHEVEENQEA